jgi:diguanylate cyclase (GGDEF)-like protein
VAAVISVSVTTVLVAAGVSAAVSVVLLGLFLVLRAFSRPSDASGERVAQLIDDLSERMETMGRELSESLERTREETRRTRVLGELAGSIDLDEVLNRALDAAGALPGVDGALVTIAGPDDEPLQAAVGLSPPEAEEHGLTLTHTGRRIRAMQIAYDRDEPEPGATPPITAGLAVPIHGEFEPLGLLSVFARAPRGEFAEDQIRELEALAARAGPAIENARRFREARHLADLDALTGLHNRRYYHETLAREVARAQRYNRRLALIVFDLDDFKAINDRVGHLAGDAVLAEVAERIRDVVRSADIACRVGGDEFSIILPESTLADAEQLYRRIQENVSARPIVHAGTLLLSAGIAELRPQDDPVGFFQRADDALYRAKEGGKGRVAAESQGIGGPALEDGTVVPGRSAISGID